MVSWTCGEACMAGAFIARGMARCEEDTQVACMVMEGTCAVSRLAWRGGLVSRSGQQTNAWGSSCT